MRAHRLLLLTLICASAFTFAFASTAGATNGIAPVITQGPADGSFVNRHSFTVAWTYAGSIPMYWAVNIDGISQAIANGSTLSFDDGPHSISITGMYLGPGEQPSDTTTVNFTVDTVAPPLTITSGPANGSTVSAASAAFAFASDPGLPVTCTADAAAPVDCTNGLALTGLTPGLHAISATSTDAAGNAAKLERLFLVQAAAGTNKKKVRFCYRTKLTKRGKIVRTKSGKVKTRRICKTVSITY